MKKKPVRIIVIIIVFLFISNSVATKIIYDSVFARYDRKEELSVLSDEKYASLIEKRESFFVNEGKETLKTYMYDAENQKGLMVIAPGLHAGADDYIPVIDSFYNAGYDVVAFDPLGCVDSSGKSPKGFSQEIEDLRSVLSYVRDSYPGEDIYLFGHSRGGFAVTAILNEDTDIKGVITVSGLNSAMEAIISLSSKYVGKIANLNYPALWCYQAMLFGPGVMGLKSDKIVSNSEVPVLVIQGSKDSTAPMDEYSIYSHKEEITGDNATYVLCSEPGQNGHTDIMYGEDGVNEGLFNYIFTEFLDNCSDEDSIENAS
ncbi:MAG: alpha/beta fold hydrolase [Lachnospiraceae bacterium]|nr:alpha/beta fold hydrolase [Lachnospiraceae bacterium]